MTSPAIPGYTFDACLGSGAFGTVWKSRWSGEFECAVKVLTPGAWHPHYLSWCLERLRREGEHHGLVRIYSYDLMNDPQHISMALLPEGTMTLEQLSGRLPAREAWTLLDNLAGTLGWLHTEGIVHTGLGSGNVFVCAAPSGEPAVLVSDIGQGWLTDAPVSQLHSQMPFMAPEHWRTATNLLQDGQAQPRDVYAFGVIAWRLLTGSWPRGAQVFDAIMANRGEDLNLQASPFADWLEKESAADWPTAAASEEESARRKIVEQCLSLDPGTRFADMKAALEALKGCPLPPPLATASAENIAFEVTEVAGGGVVAGGEKVEGTGDAFATDEPAPPRRRRFSIPLPRLSLRLQRNREDAVPWWRVLLGPAVAVVALLAAAALGTYAQKERTSRRTAENELTALRSANESLSARLPRIESEAANAASEATAARAEQVAAARHASIDIVGKVLSTQPVEDSELEAWRTAVRAMADHCAPILESAPADVSGMEARWQLARLKTALGDEDGALPVLEKLTRDLEAAAIAAKGDFPAELIRLTGRVESLTGRILTSRGRTEDALPHLRKASDSFEKWLATNSTDTESARACAHNLLLEGQGLAERKQPEQARSALMKIAGLVGKPDDPALRPEDRFLLADAQFALGRLDALQAGANVPGDPAAEENTARLLDSAITLHMDAVTMLLAYDKANKKSVPGRTRMARGYFDMGRFLARRGSGRDASFAFSESILLYTELNREQPDSAAYIREMATVYNEAAQLIRVTKPGDAGAREALDYQNFSVDSLRELNESTPLNNAIRSELAASIVLNGELLQDSGDTGNALKRYTEAITLTTELLGENALTENERREVRRLSARAWTGAAGMHERAGRRDETVAALTKALADWESAPVEDPSDQKLMAWVKEKLNKLKK
jgi:eukaryotic-like serine/threonine-protein kinase